MAEAQQQSEQASTFSPDVSLLDKIVDEGRMGRDAATKERGKDLVKNFVSEVLKGTVTLNPDTEAMINARIAQIDALISAQLNEVMHHPDFQKLEGSWRGLKYLLNNSETGTQLKIKVFNVSKKDLLKDLQKAPEFEPRPRPPLKLHNAKRRFPTPRIMCGGRKTPLCLHRRRRTQPRVRGD